ncbi:hypothetical protein [Halogeometricum luteum]|uniref:Uncharacterized protein n=1 Tax=Halogeometricum luteum TaxID=2950537 RepID=A0ABU2FZX1_9EURY|nr:hypothetical protein [Halogeometricum sp. S3BR5-2]MDS0294091.1 hypothetical protein [Halogeometricum sp. S3BR5-2]
MPSDAAGARPQSAETEWPRVESFRIKDGRCLVDDTYLHVESSYWGYYRNLYEDYWSAGWFGKVAFLSVTFVVPYGLWSLARLLRDPFGWPALAAFGAIALIALFGIYRRVVRGYTAASRIPLADVRVVETNRGMKGLTQPRLLVVYDADGATRRRYLALPSLYATDGEERFREARRVLGRAGLRVE